MSLMNDALRKKSRETTVSPIAKGFIDVSDRPRITRRWMVVLAGLVLLTVAVFYANHVMQSGKGNSLLAVNPRPGNFRPPAAHPADTTSGVQHRTAVETPPASVDPQRESVTTGEPTQKNHLTTAGVDQAPPSPAVTVDMPDSRKGQPDSALQASDEKAVIPFAAGPTASVAAPVEPALDTSNTVSRTFEPGPVQTGLREKNRSMAAHHPRSPVQRVPSPAPDPPPETIGNSNPDASTPPNAPSGEEADLFFKKARAYHRNGRLAEAVRLYRQVVNTNPGHPSAMLNLAAAYMQQGNYLEAAPLLNRLERSTPRPRGVLLNLAMAAIGMGSPDKALDYLDRATALSDATPWEIRFHRAVAFAQMNRLPEALELYRETETERPDDPRIQFNLAVTCDALGFYPEALTHYEAVLRISPEASATERETIARRIRTLRRYLDAAPSPATGQ
jgi:Flp pilus assembly protein TadD